MLCSYHSIVTINDSNTTSNQIYAHKRMWITIFTYYSIYIVQQSKNTTETRGTCPGSKAVTYMAVHMCYCKQGIIIEYCT